MLSSLLPTGLALAAALSFAPQALPFALQEGPPPTAAAAPGLGGPLVVGGVEIPQNEIKRFLIYGPCRPAMEYRRIDAMIADQIERSVTGYDDELAAWEAIKASGAQPGPKPRKVTREDFVITDEAFQKHFDHKIGDFQMKYPELSLEVEVKRAYRALHWYKRELRQEMYFDLVFVDDNPENWPALTYEAFRQEAGDILINDFKESWERRSTDLETRHAAWKAKVDEGDLAAGPEPEMLPEDSMYRSILRQIVRDTVFKATDINTAVEGLPDDMICTMDFDWDGEPELTLTTDEMWDAVKDTVTPREVDEARRFLAVIEATRQRQAQENILMSQEQAAATIEEVKAGFQSDMFNLGTVAVGNHQFPSVEAYAVYLPLLEAYKTSILPKVETPEEGGLPLLLRSHLNAANQIMGLGKVDAEIMLIGAFDFTNFEWREDGWAQALKKAEEIKAELVKNQDLYAEYRKKRMEAAAQGENYEPETAIDEPHDYWSKLLDEYCEFWDAPPPSAESGERQSAVTYKQRGRFGERTRNDLRSLMSESAYTRFVFGELLTDKVFFEQQVGTVAGPFKGPWGYYLTKVLKRTPPVRPLNVNDERHLGLLRDDWVRVSFIDYAQEALANTETTGVPE